MCVCVVPTKKLAALSLSKMLINAETYANLKQRLDKGGKRNLAGTICFFLFLFKHEDTKGDAA